MSSTVAHAEVLRALECAKCRALVEQTTSGDAEDLGDALAPGGATVEGVARHLARTWEGATHRNCHACGRMIALRGSKLHFELLRPVVPRLDCSRCASFVDACGGPVLPPRRGLVTVRPGADEPARAYGHGRLVLDDFRCGTCRRIVRTNVARGVRETSIEIDANDGALAGPPPGPRMLLAEADASVECARCGGLLREVAPAELFLADAGPTIAFSGGSPALLGAHLGPGAEHDRTCPDCSRQTCLETGLGGRPVRNGRGRMEIQPGGLGPLADGCGTCAPVVEQTVASPRHVVVSPETDRSFQTAEAVVHLPLALWDAIQARFHVSRRGDTARCDECGR